MSLCAVVTLQASNQTAFFEHLLVPGQEVEYMEHDISDLKVGLERALLMAYAHISFLNICPSNGRAGARIPAY